MKTRELLQDTTKRAIQKYHDIYTKAILERLNGDEENISKNSEEIEKFKDAFTATIAAMSDTVAEKIEEVKSDVNTLDAEIAESLNKQNKKIDALEDTIAVNTAIIMDKFSYLSSLDENEINYIIN